MQQRQEAGAASSSGRGVPLPPQGQPPGAPAGNARMRSLAIAWEQARQALAERQSSGAPSSAEGTPRTSPRDAENAGGGGGGAQEPDLAAQRRPSHARSRSSDSAYDALQQEPEKALAGKAPDLESVAAAALQVGPRSRSDVSPRRRPRQQQGGDPEGGPQHVERSAGSEQAALERYSRYPPVTSSAGLAKLQVQWDPAPADLACIIPRHTCMPPWAVLHTSSPLQRG